MQTRPAVTFPFLRASFGGQLQHIAVFDQNRLADYSGFDRDLRVLLQMAVIAMHGNEKLRTQQVDEQPLLFLAGVAADMDQSRRAVVKDDIRVATVKVVDDPIDALLVPGNDART